MQEATAETLESNSLALVAEVSTTNVEKNRESIQTLEHEMLKQPQVEFDVKHRFHGGMYAREILIPKGTLLTGRIHKFDHFDVMISGDITVSTDDGEVKRLTGYNVFQGNTGKKRAGYAHEDTLWITFHCAEERNPEEMYEFLTCGSFEELEQFQLMLEQAFNEYQQTEELLIETAQNIKDGGDL